MIRLLVNDREDKIKNNISFELYKKRVAKIRKIHGNEFDIEFLGIDEDGWEIYKGDKDSWKNFINYLYELYNKHFNFIMDDTKNRNEDDTKNKNKNEREEKMEVRTVTLDAPDYDTLKSKAEAFDKLIEIACHDGVKFYQEWNKQDVRKVCKGGSVKVGEIIGKWHGEIKFTGDDGQSDFGKFVKTMIEGMDEGQLKKIIGE